MTVLLEYHDFALDTHSWVSLVHSSAFTQILLYYCKNFQWWFFQLQTDFQFIALSSLPVKLIDFFLFLCSWHETQLHNFDTGWVILNHKKALLQWLLHLYAKIQLIHTSSCCGCDRSLPCFRCDRSLTLFCTNNSVNLFQVPGTKTHFKWTLYYVCFPSFSLIGACICVFMADLHAKWRGRRNKAKILVVCILIFFKLGMWINSFTWQASFQNGSNQVKDQGAKYVRK